MERKTYGPKTRLFAALVLTLALLVALYSIGSFASHGYVYDQAFEHEHSPAQSDFYNNFSYLQSESVCTDCKIRICDSSFDGHKAIGRAFNNGNVVQTVQVDSSGSCKEVFVTNNLGRVINAGAHDACNGRSDGVPYGCGPNSGHGS